MSSSSRKDHSLNESWDCYRLLEFKFHHSGNTYSVICRFLNITYTWIFKNKIMLPSNANTLYLYRTLQSQMLSERRIKKKKTGKAKKRELDKDQNQNTNHLRKRLERIL